MSKDLSEIQEEVFDKGARICLPRELLIIRRAPVEDGSPYVEVDHGLYSYVSTERGYEIFRKSTSSLDTLLYWIFERAVSRLALEYELRNRKEGQDPRRQYFQKKVELMDRLDAKWGLELRRDIEKTIASSPYEDK